MSVLTSPRGKAEVVHCRRTESQDIFCIKSLIRKFTQKLFGRLNIIYLLEKANLAVTLCNDKEEIMAHAIFLDYPNWNVAKQDDWVSLFQELDSEIPCTPLNTLFMHFFVAVDEYSTGCLKEIIRTVFKAVPELYFIFLIVPTYVSLGSTLITVFDQVGNIPCLTYDEDFAVHICHRHDHYPQLHIRKARVEDHDDLMPIFMHYDNTLREIYGEYFLAELIEAQDEENHAVVCEVEGKAVGFMSVCSSVNLPLLHECFDLGPFHGFCVPHPDDLLEPLKESSSIQESQDTEIKSDSQGSQKVAEEPGVFASSEAIVETQEKESEESSFEDMLSGTFSRLSDEMQDVEQKFSVISVVGDEDLTLSSESSLPSFLIPEESSHFRPIYLGESAAFCIQLFCIDEKYEARSLDFMSFVFSLFPHKNFCLISVPHLTPEFVLIQNFVKVVPFSNCTLEHDLYVFHRAGLLRSIKIRLANFVDTAGVENLVSTLVLSRKILDDFAQYNEACRDPDGTALQVFVAEVAKQIVGIAVIRKEMDIEYIRSHYNIEDFIYFSHHQQEEHGRLHHFALNPIFRHYTKFFLKEILRLGYKSCLYYPVYPQSRDSKLQNSSAHSLTSALHYLVPVRPRRQIVYPLEKLGINAPSKEVSKDQSSYALNHTNRKLTLEPKVTVNARIVVVGASSVGISFLETLVFCSHLKFNNLTLISTHGLPGKKLLGSEQRKFLASDHCFNDKDYALMSLCSWVNVVVGRMTGIDRAAKRVVVSGNETVFYDHLILCTGQQYQVPCPTGASMDQHLTNREVLGNSKLRYTGKVPHNLFILNNEEDCVKALIWMRNNAILTEGKVIVYGNTIDAYTTVETLMHIGVKGNCIYFVYPPTESNITCINNYVIEMAVKDALSAAGVTIYQDALLAQWNDGQDPDPIHSACFTTSTKPFRLECSVFFSFYKKNVDYETFKAFNDACLVYDGRLVIDTTFHTNDIAIRAAGSLTKFSNRYYSNEWTHSNFSSKEIGFQLAAAMLSLFDPTLEPVTEPPADLDRLIPMYKGAKIQGGILPGSYYYLHIAKPAIPSPLDVQRSQPDFGSEIITGNVKDGTYFRLYINKYKLVEAITCFSKEPFPASNYIRLFGQHEQVLNNLCTRFDEKLIPDLYSYFTEPWCMAIFHDRFIDLKKELRQILNSKQEIDMPSMEQLAYKIEDEEINLKEKPQKYLQRVFEDSIYKNLLEKSILDYLHYNKYHLPMYAWPGII
ncbi:cilia- and flagella-associated protein 61 isoform X1 [Peromyscus californicus insignis]|uniref:cilia- and flagella-associated protein 61 isoform X1 n=1 Tax=Peromyscus californicus insignis TaxID=564181 RepID=UPI0022A7860B|nr:cilia- and flagella-associated protein 61 isoform X1 [Peromyscus californicus insignis]XP_052578791.1 cilia- and flagella-associated protein 61 isoform X1 [Peromyscus californicus insignis]